MIDPQFSAVPVGYLTLIRSNRNFRYLWFGQLVSNLGDWFNLIASASLVVKLTDSGLAIGVLFMIRTLAPFFAAPIGGVIADRYNRRTIILITNLLRVPTILAFLVVRDAGDVWLLYLLTSIQLFIGGIFFPARSAMLPDIVSHHAIGTANAITGATFAAMLAIGSALGGLFSGLVGIYPAFTINGLLYLFSVFLIAKIQLEKTDSQKDLSLTIGKAFSEYLDGLRYMAKHSYLIVIAPHKAFMGLLLGSTFEVVQVTIAQTVFVIGDGGGSSMGLMFAFSGFGLLFSTLVIKRFVNDQVPHLMWAITAGYLVGGLGIALTALLANLGLTLIGTFLRGMGNGIVWLFSTQLILQLLPTHVRGRVVATEFAFNMVVSAGGAALIGKLLDTSLGISGVSWAMAGMTLIPAILWSIWILTGGLETIFQHVELQGESTD